MRSILLACLFLLPALAGCLMASEDRADPIDPVDSTPVSSASSSGPTGQGARDLIESYVMTHPFRLHGPGTQSFMEDARDDLEAALVGYGHYVERQVYSGGVNILAIQNGTTDPDQWVVLSAHYDTVGSIGTIGPTVYGAWDDGAGTALLMDLARGLVNETYPFTVVYAFFDGEEKGLLGSQEFVDEYNPSNHATVDLVANINTDPPGLNWPCGQMPLGHFPVKIIHENSKVGNSAYPRHTLLYDAVEYGLGQVNVPASVRDYTPGIPIATAGGFGLTGTSDHASFQPYDIANVFLGGVPSTSVGGSSGVAAMSYPLHTPLDTLDAMEARCISGSLAGGLDTIGQTMVHALDYLASSTIP